MNDHPSFWDLSLRRRVLVTLLCIGLALMLSLENVQW